MNGLKDYAKTCFYTLLHPVAGYNRYIEKKAFSKKFSFLLVLILFAAQSISMVFSGFSFQKTSSNSFDIGFTAVVVFGALILWSAASWAISTLFDGEASLNQIWFVTTVASTPYSMSLLIKTILSNILIAEEGIIITVLMTVAIMWTVLLLIVGLMLIQDYSLLAVIVSSLCALLAMAIILIIGFLFFNLFKQLYSFLSDITKELSYRIA